MSPNPYQPPSEATANPQIATMAGDRNLFILAGVGALLASAYWAALTLLIGVASAVGNVNPAQVILPVVLIVLYALRGFQLFKGNPAAAKRILWLHGVGGVVAVTQIMSGGSLVMVLNAVKVAIHIFGGVAAYLALRSYNRAMGL
jgi:hypothetical protein